MSNIATEKTTKKPAQVSAEPSSDPALSAADADFPLTMGASHHVSLTESIESMTKAMATLPYIVQEDGTIAINSEADTCTAVTKMFGGSTEDPLAAEAEKFPAYWKPLPSNWQFIDTYRVDVLFPLNDSRLTHARKKLLVCGTRTGGKSIHKDIAEAYATLGQWLIENPEAK